MLGQTGCLSRRSYPSEEIYEDIHGFATLEYSMRKLVPLASN